MLFSSAFHMVVRALCMVALVICVACSGGTTTSSSSSPREISPAGIALATSDLANPPEVASVNGVASLTLTAVVNPVTGGPAIAWNGALEPPTIRVWPGDTVKVTYVNALPPSTAEPLNTISLHFHGMTVSPNPPGDDAIDTFAMPGQTLHYQVQIPANAPPGLYWYHSHTHDEANWQVYNGMSGALVVNGIAAFASETAGLPERIIVLRNVLSQPQYSTLAVYRKTFGALKRGGGQTPAPASPCSQPWGIPGEHTTINGVNAGVSLSMQPGRKQFWRVVNASADGYYDLHVDGQLLHLVSLDGVPLTAYPGEREEDRSEITIPPAGRVEFIVMGAPSGSVLRTSCTDTGPAGDPNPPQVLATVHAVTPFKLADRPGSRPDGAAPQHLHNGAWRSGSAPLSYLHRE